MATKMPFPQAAFLDRLERLDAPAIFAASTPLSPLLVRILLVSDGTGELTKAAGCLIQLLKARKATLQASFDTELVAQRERTGHRLLAY